MSKVTNAFCADFKSPRRKSAEASSANVTLMGAAIAAAATFSGKVAGGLSKTLASAKLTTGLYFLFRILIINGFQMAFRSLKTETSS
jgi:hypothetical protein